MGPDGVLGDRMVGLWQRLGQWIPGWPGAPWTRPAPSAGRPPLNAETATGAYQIRVLGRADLPAFLDLQARAIAHLKPHEHGFLVPKPAEDLPAYCGPRGYICGVFFGGDLIAQSILALPGNRGQETELSQSGLDIPANRAAISKAMIVDCRFQGLSIQQTMITWHLVMARHAGRTQALSEVAVRNTASLKSFLSCDFRIVGLGSDPADGTPLYYVQRPLRRPRFIDRLQARTVRRALDHPDLFWWSLMEQEALLRRGYVGVAVTRDQKIVFRKVANAHEVTPRRA